MGFEVLDSMPTAGATLAGDGSPFRGGEVQVSGSYSRLTRYERWAVWLSTPFGSITRPSAAALTATHFYGCFPGRGGDVFARIPRTRFQLCWRDGAATIFQFETGYRLALPAQHREAFLELETEVKSIPGAPFRSDASTGELLVVALVAPGLFALAVLLGLLVYGPNSVATTLTFEFIVILLAVGRAGGHTLVTREGVTMNLGMLPSSSRFFPPAHFHSVVIRVRERPTRSTVTIELEVRKPTGGGKRYVIARVSAKQPARDFAERVLAPDARRVARLLGAVGPRWES